MRNFMVLLLLAVTWNQLEAFSANWTLYKRGRQISEHVSCRFFKKRSWLVSLCVLAASFSQTGEWWKKVCFIFSYISLSSSYSFSCSFAVQQFFMLLWKRLFLWVERAHLNGRGHGFGKFWAAAFPREEQDLHSLPQPCSGMCLKVCLWGGSGYPGGNPLMVRRQEQAWPPAMPASKHLLPFYLSPGLWDQGFAAPDGEFCWGCVLKAAWTWAVLIDQIIPSCAE